MEEILSIELFSDLYFEDIYKSLSWSNMIFNQTTKSQKFLIYRIQNWNRNIKIYLKE